MNLIKRCLLLMICGPLLAAVPVIDHCDIPGHRLKIAKAPTPEQCSLVCEKNKACKAFTFISGWGRCELKNQPGKQFTIKIAAGSIEMKDGLRTLQSHGYGWDNTGKDFIQQKDARTLAACEAGCLANKRCQAYAFIAGYGSCWLKKNNGKKISKNFYCGVKTTPQPLISKP